MLKASLLIIPCLMAAGCSGTCENSVAAKATSPDSKHDAVIFQRDCGATTGYSTQISILDNGSVPTGSGNIFRADDNHGVAAVGDWQGPWADIKWVAPDRLIVRYASKSRIFEQISAVDDVKIDYRQVGR